MDLQRGMRDKLENHIDVDSVFDVRMKVDGSDKYSFFCFGVDSDNKITDENYVVFHNRRLSHKSEIAYSGSVNSADFRINLSALPASINKLVFAVVVDGGSLIRNIVSNVFSIYQNDSNILNFQLNGADFKMEKAVVMAEIYKKDVWRISAVAMGFNDGLNDLTESYGKDSINLSPPQPISEETTPPQPQFINPFENLSGNPQNTTSVPPPPQKVNLQKGQSVSLVKCGNNIKGEISVNLKWKQSSGFTVKPVDLDLGCLYELKNGSKGTIQALGNRFGSLEQAPYIMLDGDDRTGASSDGETLRINAEMISQIKRILVYAFIYDGSADWQGTDGVVTVKCAGSPEIIVKMDEYGSNLTLCAVALLENVNDNFNVKKVVEFYKNQVYADNAFNWGLKWKAGKKD